MEAQGSLVLNGGFDTDIANWVTANIGINGGYRPSNGNPGGFFALADFPPSSTDPMISQTISNLVPGFNFVVSGEYQIWKNDGGGSPTDFSFGVAMDGIF